MNGTSATDSDKTKWKHNDRSKDWGEGCRIPHEEPTYFHSVMYGRKKRDLFT
jgi:hypothetical protein